MNMIGHHGNTWDHDRWWTQQQQYYRYFDVLDEFLDPALVDRTLDFALSSEVRTQDAPLLIRGLLRNGASRAAAWAFVTSHWPAIENRLGTFQGIPAIVSATGSFCEARDRDRVAAFFEANRVPAAERTLRQALERIDSCLRLKETQRDRLTAWLAR